MGIREDILGGGLAVEPFEFRGKTYWLRELSGTDREDFEIESAKRGEIEKDPSAFRGLRAFLVVRALCDEDGQRAFVPDEADDMAKAMSGALMDAMFDAVMERNGLRGSDVEAMAGKSDDAPSGDSGSV